MEKIKDALWVLFGVTIGCFMLYLGMLLVDFLDKYHPC